MRHSPKWSVSIARILLSGALPLLLTAASPADDIERRYDKWRPISDRDWDTTSFDSLGISHAAILFNGYIFDDSELGGDRVHASRYLRVLVLDDKGIEDFGTVEIPFAKGDKITKLKARTLKPDGTAIEIDKKDVHEKTLASYGKKAALAKSFAFKGVEKGDILEYFYTQRSKPSPPPAIQLRGRYYTFMSRVTWLFKRMPKLSWEQKKAFGDYTFAPAYVITNGRQFGAQLREVPNSENPEGIQVIVDHLPPLEDEPYMPNDEAVSTLFFGHYKLTKKDEEKPFWERLAEAWGEHTLEFMKKDSKLDSWMEEIGTPTDLESDLERCLAKLHESVDCYEFLPEYERPEEPPDPDNVNDLIKEGIGSRYEIDMLLVAILRRLGYDATPFWIRDRAEGMFIRQWQSADQFTFGGVAIQVEEQLHWCVPGFRLCSPTSVPWEAIGCSALLEDLSGEKEENPFPIFAPIPMPDSRQNRVSLRVTLRPGEDLKARGRLEASWSCSNDLFFINSILTEQEGDIVDKLRRRAIGTDLDWTAFDEEHSLDGLTVSYACSVEVEGIVENAGSMQLVNLGLVRTDDYQIPEADREFPVQLRFPVQYESQVDLILPQGFAPEEVVPGGQQSQAWASFVSQSQVGEDRIRLLRNLDLRYNLFTIEGGAAVKSFFDNVYSATADPVVLVRQVPSE